MKKAKGLFPEKYLWKGKVCSRTANYAYISGYAGRKMPTRKRLKAMRDEKTALTLFLRRKECLKATIIHTLLPGYIIDLPGEKQYHFPQDVYIIIA
ncbi:MAG: hypothetical protein ACE5GV_16130 [Candidatus Scalindua sp.]